MADPEPERVDVEVHVGDAVVSLSMTGVDISCAEEVTSAVAKALLNDTQRDRRKAVTAAAAEALRT